MALAVHGNRIEEQNLFEQAKHLFDKNYHIKETEKLAEKIISEGSISLAERVISYYKNDNSVKEILTNLDRKVLPLRFGQIYTHPDNQDKLAKWRAANLPEEVFHNHPKFVKFLFDALLVSQIRVGRQEAVKMQNGEPALWSENRWIGEKELLERFEIAYAPSFKQVFPVDQASGDVFSFLGNGKGFQKYHPCLSTPAAVTQLTEEEYDNLRSTANLFIRAKEASLDTQEREKLNEERPYFLQVITHYEKKNESNLYEVFANPVHSYLRFVVGQDDFKAGLRKGDVIEIGFGRSKKQILPLSSMPGQLRSPDTFGYSSKGKKITTTIPIDEKEAAAFYSFVTRYLKEVSQLGKKIGYHTTYHNCCVFLREACKAANIEVETEITLPEALTKSIPDWIKAIGLQLKEWKTAALNFLQKPLPKKITAFLVKIWSKVAEIWKAFVHTIVSLFVFPLRLALGDAIGEEGLAFKQKGQPPETIGPQLHSPKSYPDFRMHLPVRILDWQKAQLSTQTL